MFNRKLFVFLHISPFPSRTYTGAFHAHTQWTSFMLTLPYVGLGVEADAKTRQTSQYQQSTACLLPLTHHQRARLIINLTKVDSGPRKLHLKTWFLTHHLTVSQQDADGSCRIVRMHHRNTFEIKTPRHNHHLITIFELGVKFILKLAF